MEVRWEMRIEWCSCSPRNVLRHVSETFRGGVCTALECETWCKVYFSVGIVAVKIEIVRKFIERKALSGGARPQQLAGKAWEIPLEHQRTLYVKSNRTSAGSLGSRLVFRTYSPYRKKTLNNSTSAPPGNPKCLQTVSVGHTGYPASSSTITKRDGGNINFTHRWSTRLSLRNTVFQAELLALLKAVEHAFALPTQQLTILVDKQASIQSAANPKSHNTIPLKIIFKLLHGHPHIRVQWIKAHVGYIGNEEVDRLAKEAAETESFPETPFELRKSFIKIIQRQKMMATWQVAWYDGDTKRLIHNNLSKVSLQPINCTRNEILFFTDMGLSHRISIDSTLPIHHSVLVGELTHQSIMPWNASSQPPTIWHHPDNNISQSSA
ncbi:hypothetical protein AVEN_101404-1 [Araneus ventricosus]|uniref:ribonuclease H n=1 Tax=Araneus ventricosus TaxID=182803 RepID=A0A4Y2LD05_ARAVE|nr:hypothetical protein AVEN_101404-1 [Araneus ventricosus]